MFGRNPVRKRDLGDGESLRLQGLPWCTIQGEGPYAGQPATFIRLWGCHLQCWFCDTDFESDEIGVSVNSLVERCRGGPGLVVLTGGEPMRQNIAVLCHRLAVAGHTVQVETAGSFWVPSFTILPDFVVSPKTPSVHLMIENKALAWKYVISTKDRMDPDDGLPITDMQAQVAPGHPRPLARPPQHFPRSQVYLQPMDEQDPVLNKSNMALCVDLSLRHGYRISLQQHKILGVV